MPARYTKALLPLLAALLPVSAVAGNAEAIFADAAEYTLRVDVTVQVPFVEDALGAHFGAAFIVDNERRWAITNSHVATRSPARLRATLIDGQRVGVQRVYVDPYVDIAVLDLSEAEDGDDNNGRFSRVDEETTPRLGFIYKPAENVSIYASYSETFLPRSGDQFLTLGNLR